MPKPGSAIIGAVSAALLVLGTGAAARAQPLANLVGNTLKMTTRGSTIAYMFKPDGALTAVVGGGTRMDGKWRVDGPKMCLKLGMKGFMGPEQCIPAVPASKHVGDSWDTTYNGVTTHAEIVAGQGDSQR